MAAAGRTDPFGPGFRAPTDFITGEELTTTEAPVVLIETEDDSKRLYLIASIFKSAVQHEELSYVKEDGTVNAELFFERFSAARPGFVSDRAKEDFTTPEGYINLAALKIINRSSVSRYAAEARGGFFQISPFQALLYKLRGNRITYGFPQEANLDFGLEDIRLEVPARVEAPTGLSEMRRAIPVLPGENDDDVLLPPDLQLGSPGPLEGAVVAAEPVGGVAVVRPHAVSASDSGGGQSRVDEEEEADPDLSEPLLAGLGVSREEPESPVGSVRRVVHGAIAPEDESSVLEAREARAVEEGRAVERREPVREREPARRPAGIGDAIAGFFVAIYDWFQGVFRRLFGVEPVHRE